MNSTMIMDGIGLVLLGIFALTCAVLYIANIVRLVKVLTAQKYSIQFVIRGVGVFFPVVGIIMGLVK